MAAFCSIARHSTEQPETRYAEFGRMRQVWRLRRATARRPVVAIHADTPPVRSVRVNVHAKFNSPKPTGQKWHRLPMGVIEPSIAPIDSRSGRSERSREKSANLAHNIRRMGS